MNKKFLYIAGVITVIIIVLIILGLRSCEPRVKEQPIAAEGGKTQSEVERSDFINANIEFTCEILKNPSLKDDKKQTETRVKEVFKKHNLPVDSNESMVAILKKYKDDEAIATIVKENAKPCVQGGEPVFVE